MAQLQVYAPQAPPRLPGVRRLYLISSLLPGLACDVCAHSRLRELANIAAVSPPLAEAEAMPLVPAGHDDGQHHLVWGAIDNILQLSDRSKRFPPSTHHVSSDFVGGPIAQIPRFRSKNAVLTDGGTSMTGFLSTAVGLRLRDGKQLA